MVKFIYTLSQNTLMIWTYGIIYTLTHTYIPIHLFISHTYSSFSVPIIGHYSYYECTEGLIPNKNNEHRIHTKLQKRTKGPSVAILVLTVYTYIYVYRCTYTHTYTYIHRYIKILKKGKFWSFKVTFLTWVTLNR